MSNKKESKSVIPPEFIVPFILVTILFPLWGFANDITNPMVAAFKNILLISNFKSALVQFAFYGGYAFMAIPAALFIKRFSYKQGVLIGLGLYALGCLLFIPSGMSMLFPAFLLSYFIMTCGLSFLETTANPYILSMGPEETATRRLNLSQSFNPMGSILGMFVASTFILANLNPASESGRSYLKTAFEENKPVYVQVAESQLASLDGLAEIVADSGWQSSGKLLKKGSALSGELYQTLSILSDPKPQQTLVVSEMLSNMPSKSLFNESVGSVAVVLQMKDAPEPDEALVLRDKLYFDAAGFEMALALARELPLLTGDPGLGFSQAQSSFAKSALLASQINEAFGQILLGEKPTDIDLKVVIAETKSELESGLKHIRAVPPSTFGAYFASLGEELSAISKGDLGVVTTPYALMGVILLLVLILFAYKLPASTGHEGSKELDLGGTLKRLIKNPAYIEGVVAQTFYVGAQIMCWTFIIQYAELELGMSKATAQNCNILAMIIFVSSRFICTFLLHYVSPGGLLATLATAGAGLILGTIFLQGYAGLYCLMGVSACMSLMFPTIYGIALRGLGDDAKLGSAGLILAIGGGCLMPPLQGWIIDFPAFDLGFMELASVRASFVLPLICFVVIALYGLRTVKHLKAG
jgi:fucose permease